MRAKYEIGQKVHVLCDDITGYVDDIDFELGSWIYCVGGHWWREEDLQCAG